MNSLNLDSHGFYQDLTGSISKKSSQRLLWFIAAAIILKSVLASHIAIYVISNSLYDDALMVDLAKNLLKGEWLGPYHNRVLVKGITFPLFLALNYLSGIPYNILLTVIYGLACGFCAKTAASLTRSGLFGALLFLALFFDPSNGCVPSFIRIYRNALLPPLVLLLFAGFFNLYFSRKRSMLRVVFLGIVLALFWNLREDSVWILPFTIAVSLFTVIKHITVKKGLSSVYKSITVAVIPFLILIGANLTICGINQHYYGVFTRNELSEGGFAELITALHKIQPEEEYYRVSVPKSTADLVYEASPTFAKLKPYLDKHYNGGWGDVSDGYPDGQIMDGWFFWSLRNCFASLGDEEQNAVYSDHFYRQAAQEINDALADGRLPKRTGVAIPSALASPWRDEYRSTFPLAFHEAFWYVADHNGQSLQTLTSTGNKDSIRRVELLTHGEAIYPNSLFSEDSILINGSSLATGIYEAINHIYRFIGRFVTILGLFAYAAMTALMVFDVVQKKWSSTTDIWLVLSGILWSVLVLCAMVAYTHISAFSAINSLYLAAAYPLLTAFNLLSPYLLFLCFRKHVKSKSAELAIPDDEKECLHAES